MFRKLAGSSFAAVLLAIVALKHVALGFCLCQLQITTDPGDCCAAVIAEPTCCCATSENSAADPCKDCVIELDLEIGDYLWSADEFSPADQIGLPLTILYIDLPTLPLQPQTLSFSHPVRGSPPGLLPLSLRHSVLRL